MPAIRRSVISQAVAASASSTTTIAAASRRRSAAGAATGSTRQGEVRPETHLGAEFDAEHVKMRASLRLTHRYLAVREPSRGRWIELGGQTRRRSIVHSAGNQLRDPEAALIPDGQHAGTAFGGVMHRHPLHPKIFADHA